MSTVFLIIWLKWTMKIKLMLEMDQLNNKIYD
jgi:hypothetical protein